MDRIYVKGSSIVWGFLASTVLSSVYKEEGKGNYSIEDQIAALLGLGYHFRPTIDQRVLVGSSFQAYVDDHHPRIPVIAGYNRGETDFFRKPGQKEDEPGMIEAARMGAIYERRGVPHALYRRSFPKPSSHG